MNSVEKLETYFEKRFGNKCYFSGEEEDEGGFKLSFYLERERFPRFSIIPMSKIGENYEERTISKPLRLISRLDLGNYRGCCGIIILNSFYHLGVQSKEQKAIPNLRKDCFHAMIEVSKLYVKAVINCGQLQYTITSTQELEMEELPKLGFELVYKGSNPRHSSTLMTYIFNLAKYKVEKEDKDLYNKLQNDGGLW